MNFESPFTGLILTGGQSSRMGQPKFLLNYHGVPHVEFLRILLSKYCNAVNVSCSEEQSHNFSVGDSYIVDDPQFKDCGPLGGILSAYLKVSGPFIILGCDYPYFNEGDLKELLLQRDSSVIATVFRSPVDQLPEPFPGIYEESSRGLLLDQFLRKEYSIRRFLSASNSKIIVATNPICLKSVDTPEEYLEAQLLVKKLQGTT